MSVCHQKIPSFLSINVSKLIFIIVMLPVSTLPARCMQHSAFSVPHVSKSPSKLASFSSWLSPEVSHDTQPSRDSDDPRKSVRFDALQPGNTSSLKKHSHVILANGHSLPVSRADVCVLTDSHYPPYSADVGSLV